MKENK
jgi:hypothetical protein